MNKKYGKLHLLAVTIFIVSFAVYLPAIGYDFVNWDDNEYVYENPHFKAPDVDFVIWAFSTTRQSNWHPLTWLSLSLDYSLWGLNPAGYHLTNIFLHALNALFVVYLTAFLFTKDESSLEGHMLFASALVGTVFGLHPLHVESVVWISERKDVLYALFWLISLLAYIGYASSIVLRHRIFYFSFSLFTFILSLLAKPMAVTLPVVFLILDYYPLKRLDLKRGFIKIAVLEKLPFFLLSLASSIVTIIAQNKGGAMEAMKYLSLWERLWISIKAYGFYIAKTIWPLNLVPLYPLNLNIFPLKWEYFGALLLILCISAISLKLWKHTPVLISAWTYYVVTLLPVIGIVQVGAREVADRYMYLPILGPLIVLGVLGSKAWKMASNLRHVLIASTIFITMVMSILTVGQISVWKNSFSLWEYVIKKDPKVTIAYYNLGNAYRDKGDLLNAEKAWKSAVKLEPKHSKALNQLGNIYFLTNSLIEAKKHYYLAVESDYKNVEPRYNLARTLEKLGETDEAIKHYEILLNTASSEYAYLFPKIRQKLSIIKYKKHP